MAQEKILVIKLSALGDFILALGAMEAIRKAHPVAHITLLTTRLFNDMATRSRYFDAVEIDARPKFWQVGGWAKLARFFSQGGFARVYDLQLNDRTKIYSRLFGKRPEWSGVIEGSPLFYSNPQWRDMHAFKRHQEVLKVADIEMGMPSLAWMESDVSLISPGQPAKIRLDAYPDLLFNGRIETISPLGVQSSLTAKVRNFTAVVSIQGMDPQLMPDLSASVEIEILRKF